MESIPEGMKRCRACRVVKHLSNFYKHKDYKDGFRAICKNCSSIKPLKELPDHLSKLPVQGPQVMKVPLSGEKGEGLFALVDAGDYEKVFGISWSAVINDGKIYATGWPEGLGKSVRMHRLIMDFPETLTDHKNGNGLDNRRQNLRRATNKENGRNRLPTQRQRAAKYKGVTLNKPTGLWVATVRCDGKNLALGCFDSQEEAARAYDSAALFLYGEFAKPNFDESLPENPQAIRARFSRR